MTVLNIHYASRPQPVVAFTLLEVLAISATLGLLVMLMVPGRANTKSSARGFRCLENTRQLLWLSYSSPRHTTRTAAN